MVKSQGTFLIHQQSTYITSVDNDSMAVNFFFSLGSSFFDPISFLYNDIIVEYGAAVGFVGSYSCGYAV